MFRGGRVAEDLNHAAKKLRNHLAGHVGAESLALVDKAEPVWPPRFTPTLPARRCLASLERTSSTLRRDELVHACVLLTNVFHSVFAKFADSAEMPVSDQQFVAKVVDAVWQAVWSQYGSGSVDRRRQVEECDLGRLQEMIHRQSLGSVPRGPSTIEKQRSRHIVNLALAGLLDGVVGCQKADRQAYLAVAKRLLQVADYCCELPYPEYRCWVDPTIFEKFGNPVQRSAWETLRFVTEAAVDVEGSRGDDTWSEYEECERLSYSAFTQDCYATSSPPAGVSSPHDNPRSVAKVGARAQANPTGNLNESYCLDYRPGDLVMESSQALELYRDLDTLCKLLNRIVVEYDAGKFDREYFLRVDCSDDYGDVWAASWTLDRIVSEAWPRPCEGQWSVLLQMCRRFTIQASFCSDIQWWGGWADPVPTEYCWDCDPESRHVGS